MNSELKKRRTRVGVLTFALAGLFVVALFRLVVLVVMDGPRLDSLARSEHTGETDLAAVRGPIVDRNGEPLALSAEARSIYARPKKLLAHSTVAERATLAKMLGLAPARLAKVLDTHSPFVWLRRGMAPAVAQKVEALGLEGVGALGEYKRYYPEGDLAAAVVGLAGIDGQGLSGIELLDNRYIRGQPVELNFYHDAYGHPIFDSPLALKSARPGDRVELTIDGRIQSLADHRLAEEVRKSGASHGTAIVLNPFTGEVLALANVSAKPNPIRARLKDPAIQDVFEPGSTMKSLLISTALKDHVITPDQTFFCENGSFHVKGGTIHDDSPHQWLNVGQIIEVSSNIGASKIAFRLGADHYYEGLKAFGLGRPTGIDLPGEAGGIVRPASKWRQIDLANHAFGQGIALTPMQLAVAYAAIANGGLVMRPYVVKSIRDPEGRVVLAHTPQVVDRAIPPAVAHQMNVMLRNPVYGPHGTAHLAQVAGFTIAGKTGTAQRVDVSTGRYYRNHFNSSFVGFLPARDPRLVIVVVLYDVNGSDYGGVVAAPVFSQIALGAANALDIPSNNAPAYDMAGLLSISHLLHLSPTMAAASAAPLRIVAATDSGSGSKTTPNFTGLSLRRAFDVARRIGVNLKIDGDGYVVRQYPAAGAPLAQAPVRLKLASAESAGTEVSRGARLRRASWKNAGRAR